jgi:hypothetical protein
MDLTRDCIRKRKEEEEARAKERAAQPGDPVTGKAADPAMRSPDIKSIGQIIDDALF